VVLGVFVPLLPQPASTASGAAASKMIDVRDGAFIVIKTNHLGRRCKT
jgi:hypothetical protein